jgi:hypothetical protein
LSRGNIENAHARTGGFTPSSGTRTGYHLHERVLKVPRARDYSYEALAEVTSTDQNVGRGELNAALRDIRKQTPEITDSYLLGVEIHDRAKMYRALFENAALTPTALAKHWIRVKEETKPRPTMPNPPSLPVSRREQNLTEARKILEMFK